MIDFLPQLYMKVVDVKCWMLLYSWPPFRHGSSVIKCLRFVFCCGKIVPLSLIQEEQVISYQRKNGHFILVNYRLEACPRTVWFKVTDHLDMTSAVYCGRKASNQTKPNNNAPHPRRNSGDNNFSFFNAPV